MINTYWALLLPPLANTFGVFLMMQFMESAIPESVLEAGRIDGATEYRMFYSVGHACGQARLADPGDLHIPVLLERHRRVFRL